MTRINSTAAENLLAMEPRSVRSRINYTLTHLGIHRVTLFSPQRILIGVILILLAACAPQQQEFKPVSQTPKIEKQTFTTSDGTALPMRTWMVKRPRAVVIGVHGFNDYSKSFEGAGAYFRKHGIATYAYDQRGFGTAPQTGIWAGEENLTRDLRDFTVLVAKRHPKTPLFIMGESMGGAVVMLTEKTYHPKVSGIILSAPAVWSYDYMPVLYPPLLWISAHTLPEYKLTGKNLKIQASNNIEMLRALGRDPLVIKATRIDTIYGLTHLMNDAYHAPEAIYQPSLLLYGYKDQVIPRGPIEGAKDRFATPTKAIFYDDGYHMLTRDLQGKEVLSDIADWVLTSAR